MRKEFLITLAGALVSAAAMGQGVTRLPTLGGTGSIARDINDLGQIVGESTLAGDLISHATIWNGQTATDLGSLNAGDNSVAWAINNLGVAVGTNDLPSGVRTATMFESRGLIDIGAAAGAVNGNSVAWDINDNGMVAGQASINPGFAKGFFWNPSMGGVVGGTIFQGGANLSINNSGSSVGHSYFFGDPNNATVSEPDGRGGYTVADISPIGYAFSIASAISNSGIVVGHTNGAGLGSDENGGGWQAVIYEQDGRGGTNYVPMGRLDGLNVSEALDVNDSGLIVGYGWDGTSSGLAPRAFAWNDGTMYDLNDFLDSRSEFTNLIQATGVNENGDIVGFGQTTDGQIAGFVLNGFVPSPASGTTIIFASIFACRRRR